MYYTLINPSDDYTLKASEPKVAVLATVLVGGGRYGLIDEQGNQVMPVFLIGGLDEWFTEQFGGTPNEHLKANWLSVAECLESFAICDIRERKLWAKGVEAMSESARSEWLAEWHDRHRTSMNDIGGRAMHYAKRMRDKAQGRQGERAT